MDFQPGMLLAFSWDENNYGLCKVIDITKTNREPIINIVTYSNSYPSIPENVITQELKPMVIHMPMYLPAMEASNCTEIGTAEITSEERLGCENWLNAWKERRTGFFDRSIPESVDHILEKMAYVDDGTSDPAFRERLMQRWQGPR